MAVSDNLWIGDLPPEIDEVTVKNVFEGYGTILSSKLIPPKANGKNAAALVRFESIEDARWVVENLNGNMPEGFETPVVVQYAKNPPGGPHGHGKPSASPGKGYDYRSSPYPQPPPPAIDHGKGGYGKSYGGKGGGGKGTKGSKSFANTDKGNFKGSKSFTNATAGNFKGYIASLAKAGRLPGVGTRPDEHCVYIKNLPPDTQDLDLYRLFSVFGAIAHNGVTAMTKEDGSCLGVGFVDFQDPMSAAAAVEVLNGTAMPDGTVINLNLKRSKGGRKGGKGPSQSPQHFEYQSNGGGEELQLEEELLPFF